MCATVSTKDFMGMHAIGGKKDKRIGKVHNFVFHPTEKRLVGFLVKRPDAAMMFHRKDLFVALDGYTLVEGEMWVSDTPGSTDSPACKRMGVKFEDCVMWWGMPVLCEDGTEMGHVNEIAFDRETGAIEWLCVESTTTSKVLLGQPVIPANMIKGFRRGMGEALTDQVGPDGFPLEDLGAILVSDQVKEVKAVGGVAEKAGAATAVATHKVKRVVRKVAPKQEAVANATADAINKGAYAVGEQLGKAKGMFAAFADEYKKASK